MRLHTVKYGIVGFIFLFVYGCAQINPLDGGPKDVYSPRIDTAGTNPYNGQTSFKGDRVVLKFSEYISLNNPSENIIITPQLKEDPTIAVKNKKLTIQFNENLQENTTYTLSFNHAIKDITEQNDSVFQFVFSTGTYIDSLALKGTVTDAFTNQKQKGFLVGLYALNDTIDVDSIPFLTRPIYFGQTAENGRFSLSYLKEGQYHLYAFLDQNRNLLLDPSETRAFMVEDKILVKTDTHEVNLTAFKPFNPSSKLLNTKFDYPGRVELVFSNPPNEYNLSSQMDLLQENTGRDDSLVFWLEDNPVPKMQFYLAIDDAVDTLKPLYQTGPKLKKKIGLNGVTNLIKGELLPKTKFKITYPEALENFDSTGIHFYNSDSVEIEGVEVIIDNQRSLVFEDLPKEISWVAIDSGAVFSRYDHYNLTDDWWSVKLLDSTYFGHLILNMDTTYSTPVLVDLLNEKNEVVKTQNFERQMRFYNLIPGDYQLRLIFDDNNDGEWTGGSLKERRQPEKVLYNNELIRIKSKWEKEIDWFMQN